MNRILLVDDEKLVLQGLQRALRCDSVEVRTATSAEEAVAAMEECSYDLCFLDIRLPGMSGIELLDWIRKCSPRTKVAVISASHMEEAEREYIRKTADYFVWKPVDLAEVRAIVSETLKA